MKTVAIIPIKSHSKRLKRKNFKIINGKPLYRYLLDNLHKCNFDEIYIDSDSKEIEKYCLKKYLFIKDYKISKIMLMEIICKLSCQYDYADYYFQLFVTAPLLKVKSINKCIKILKGNKKLTLSLRLKKFSHGFGIKINQ